MYWNDRILLLKRRDAIGFETKGAFPWAGCAKILDKQRYQTLKENENCQNLQWSFQNYLYVYLYLCLTDNASVLRPRWGVTKVQESIYKTEDLGRKKIKNEMYEFGLLWTNWEITYTTKNQWQTTDDSVPVP